MKVDWADIPGASGYRIRCRLVGTTAWTVKSGAKSQKNLNGLIDGVYEYQLRVKCIDGWQPWSPKITFEFGDATGGDTGSNEVTVRITLDDYGSETRWELYGASNALIQFGGPYEDGQSGQVRTTNFSLSDGCYEIDLYDSFGDGICCDYGHGKFEILRGSTVIASSDGIFGYYELVQFCIQDGAARIVKHDRDTKKASRGKKSK